MSLQRWGPRTRLLRQTMLISTLTNLYFPIVLQTKIPLLFYEPSIFQIFNFMNPFPLLQICISLLFYTLKYLFYFMNFLLSEHNLTDLAYSDNKLFYRINQLSKVGCYGDILWLISTAFCRRLSSDKKKRGKVLLGYRRAHYLKHLSEK